MKKLLLIASIITTVLLVTMFSVFVPYVYGNPYGLFGEGNCAKFAYDCMDAFWPMTPDIDGDWDAYKWTQLIGQQKDGYVVEQVYNPQPGDVYVLPKTEQTERGHVGMVVGINWSYSLERGTKQTNYAVIESNNNATYPDYPLMYRGCRYRQTDYPAEHLEGAVFLRCTKIEQPK